MNLRLYTSSIDSQSFSKSFSTKLRPKFKQSAFLFVDFSINESHKDVFKIHVFYNENGFFYTKFISKDLIRHAFGKWNRLNFMLAREKNNPLNPLFIFDFPLDNSKSQYDAMFASINGQLHILSKIYNLSEEHFKLLKKSYKLYKVEGEDYTLFDFGNCFSFIDKFLNNLEIILEDVDFKLNNSGNLIIDPISIDSIRKREDDYKYCMICGKKLELTLNKNLLELSRKFPARCENCLKQIYALDLYNKLNEGPISSNMLSKSELEYMWDEEGLFEYNFKLLKDYGFLKPFSEDIYKLYINEDINEAYSSLLNPVEEKEEESESKFALDDYFGFNDKKEIFKCKICGEEIDDGDSMDICSNCFDKQMTIEKIHQLIEYVKPGSGFSKSSLIEKGFNTIDLDIIISDLEDNDLLRYDSDDLIILANRKKLNDFIKEYSDSDEYIIEITEDDIPKLNIDDKELISEDTLDKAINLIDYQKFVECHSSHENSKWTVTLKKEGQNFLTHDFSTPFQAKLNAVRYLDEIGVITIIKDNHRASIESDFSYEDSLRDKEAVNSENHDLNDSTSENHDLNDSTSENNNIDKKCLICGNVIPQKNYSSNRKFCDDCKSKYTPLELTTLVGIKEGKYTKKTAISIKKLKEEGKTNSQIAKTLNIYNAVIPHITKFLLDNDNQSQVSDKNIDEVHIQVCPICKKTFKENKKEAGQKYCDDCKSRFTPLELTVLLDIEKGIYTKELALEILKYKNEGKTNNQISNLLKLPHPAVVQPILNFLLDENEISNFSEVVNNSKSLIKEKTCPICCKKFTPKSPNGSDIYCSNCKKKFALFERQVYKGVITGKYNDELAKKLKDLKELGKTNTDIAAEENVPLGLINPIIRLLLEDDGKIEGISYNDNLSKWFVYVKNEGKYVNLGFYDTKEEAILAKHNYFKNLNNEDHIQEFDYLDDDIKNDPDPKIFEDETHGVVNYKDDSLGVSETEEKAFEYRNSYSDSNNVLKKQLITNEEENSFNLVLDGIISEDERSSMFEFIPLFNLDLNKLLCDKIEDGNYDFSFDFNIDKSNLENILLKLKQLGWE